MDVKALQSRIEGKVMVATDAGYEQLRRSLIWNQLTPKRYPQVVVQVASEQDVVEAVRFARTQNMNIAVRGGGHSWVGFPLCNGSLLIDLGRLNQISVGHQTRTASVQPAVTGQALNQQLVPHGLAFPVGHCQTVPMSGYLLNGGLGWNWNTWGPACFSVEAANVVLADGVFDLGIEAVRVVYVDPGTRRLAAPTQSKIVLALQTAATAASPGGATVLVFDAKNVAGTWVFSPEASSREVKRTASAWDGLGFDAYASVVSMDFLDQEPGVIPGLGDAPVIDPGAPFGGFKESGFGREGGRAGLHGYLQFRGDPLTQG